MPMQLRLIFAALLFLSGLSTGWQINSWKNDATELAITKTAQAVANENRTAIASMAASLENKIASGVITQRIIERGVIKEIRNNETIYRNICITDAGRVQLNNAAKGRVSSESASIMP